METMLTRVKKFYWDVVGDRSQDRAILRFLRQAGADSKWNILDVGCGYGRNLRVIRTAGLQPTGVEVNPNIAEIVRAAGFTCFAPDDTRIQDTKWDAILMSHIIEHFDYQSLFQMMNRYITLLRPHGFLVIATPLPNPRFYDNFDHVKPYTPAAIEEVFGRRGMQVQFQAEYELELLGLWVRRRPLSLQLFGSLFRRDVSMTKALLRITNVALVLMHYVSFKILGTKDGWVGLYRKTS